ncbi:MAG: MOSC domain-containing protein YiiM [Paraglaciecola sp.]|jgi:MOSC domain-containing protein YiiM
MPAIVTTREHIIDMQLVDIAYRLAPRGDMQRKTNTMVTRVAGVEDDAKRRAGKRQVTVLSIEQWHQACAELGTDLPWTIRRANLLVQGLMFGPQHVGQQLIIGALHLLITAQTDPCPKMDAQYQGLTQALVPNWRGGVCCLVLSDGRIHLGDRVTLK